MTQPIIQLLLALSPLITAVLGALFWRETKRQKRAEADRAEQEAQRTGAETDRTEAETTEIANKAASINEERERKREEWWAKQFGDLRDEFEGERKLSLDRYRQLNKVENYLDVLMRYVRALMRRLSKYEPDIEEPPSMPDGTDPTVPRPVTPPREGGNV